MEPILLISHPNLYSVNQENSSPTDGNTQQALTDLFSSDFFLHVLNHFQHTKWLGFFQVKISIRLGNLKVLYQLLCSIFHCLWQKILFSECQNCKEMGQGRKFCQYLKILPHHIFISLNSPKTYLMAP